MTIEKASKFLKNNTKLDTSIIEIDNKYQVWYKFNYKDNQYGDFIIMEKKDLKKAILMDVIEILEVAKESSLNALKAQ